MRAMRSPTRAVPAQERRSCLSFPVILSRTVSVSPDQEYEATEKPSDRWASSWGVGAGKSSPWLSMSPADFRKCLHLAM